MSEMVITLVICLLLLAANVVTGVRANSIIDFISGLEKGNTSWTRLYDSDVSVKLRPPLASTTLTRNSSLVIDELISETAFRSIADVEMSSKWPVEIESWLSRPSRQLSLLVKHLQPGTVIFVSNDLVDKFFTHMYQQINVPFVLVSTGGDRSIDPTPYLLSATYSNILHWYSKNCRTNIVHSQFSCLPVGLLDWMGQKEAVASVATHLSINKNLPFYSDVPKNTSFEVLLSFHIANNPTARTDLWIQFCGELPSNSNQYSYVYNNKDKVNALCLPMTGAWNHLPDSVTENDLYRHLAATKFVISPHGSGLDCARTWEALYMGAYVIVKTSYLDSLYAGLPVLIVKDWSDVTPELLQRTYLVFQQMKFNYDVLNLSYWNIVFSNYGYNRYIYRLQESPSVTRRASRK